VDLFGSDGVFRSLSAALPLGLVDLQACLVAAITLDTSFLWEGGCLFGGLDVAGMAGGGAARGGSRHGSWEMLTLFHQTFPDLLLLRFGQ